MYNIYKNNNLIGTMFTLNELYRVVRSSIEDGDTADMFQAKSDESFRNFDFELDIEYTISEAVRDYRLGVDYSNSFPDFLEHYKDDVDFWDDDVYSDDVADDYYYE